MDPKHIIQQIESAGAAAGFKVEAFGQIGNWPLLGMERHADTEAAQNIYLSSGMHGGEPAGPLALRELIREDALPREHNYWICPLLNPTGLEADTRESADGLDLKRDYSDLSSKGIRAHIVWVEQNIQSLNP